MTRTKAKLRALYGADINKNGVNEIRRNNGLIEGYNAFMVQHDKAENTMINSISQLGNVLETIAEMKGATRIDEEFINSITEEDISAYWKKLTSKKISSSKKQFKLMVLADFFQNHLKKNWNLQRDYHVKREQKDIVYMNDDQAKKFMSAINDLGDEIFFSLQLGSGLRREEAKWLYKEDIDEKNMLVHIRINELHHPKGKKERISVLSKQTLNAIKKYERPQAADKKWEPLLLLNPKGNPLSMSTMRGRFVRYCKKARIRSNWGMHRLRTTFANMMARKYLLEQTHILLGHSDLRTTQKYYADLKKQISVKNARSPLDTETDV